MKYPDNVEPDMYNALVVRIRKSDPFNTGMKPVMYVRRGRNRETIKNKISGSVIEIITTAVIATVFLALIYMSLPWIVSGIKAAMSNLGGVKGLISMSLPEEAQAMPAIGITAGTEKTGMTVPAPATTGDETVVEDTPQSERSIAAVSGLIRGETLYETEKKESDSPVYTGRDPKPPDTETVAPAENPEEVILNVSGIICDEDGECLAIIGNRICRKNDKIMDATIVEITPRYIKLEKKQKQ